MTSEVKQCDIQKHDFPRYRNVSFESKLLCDTWRNYVYDDKL